MIKRLVWAVALAAPVALLAQVTTQGHAQATIVQPLTLVEQSQMNFGRIADLGGAGGDVNLTHQNALVADAGLQAGGGAPQAAVFAMTGPVGSDYTVAVNPRQFNLTRQGGAETMQVDVHAIRFGDDAQGFGLDGIWGTLPPAPAGAAGAAAVVAAQTFTLASTLTVAAAQAPGIYEGQYAVTIDHH